MAALVEGVEYGLSSLRSTSSNKSVVYVKLTDSALKQIDEYNSLQDPAVPRITFNGQKGVICIPGRQDERSYSFSLAALHCDPKGSFDCVQQGASRSHRGLEQLGSFQYTARLHANEDSFETTRQRMAVAEEESKSKIAKEIKRGGPHEGKRVKVIKKHEATPTPPQSRFSPIDPNPRLVHHNTTKPSSIVNSPHTNHVSHKASPQPEIRNSGASRSNPSNQRMSPSLHVNGTNAKPAHPEVLKKPLRERLIHMLAPKPYKKPEILVRLKREGLREKDKSQITPVLQQVASFNTKDNAYSLFKHLYSQVKLDWPEYTEDDIARIKKKLALENRSSTPPNVSPAVSPVHSIGSQGSPTNGSQPQKRAGEAEQLGPQAKKPRVAHGSKPRPHSPSVQPPKHNSDTPHVKSSLKTNHIQADEKNNNVDSRRERQSALEDQENQDFVNAYGRISSLDQRQNYKRDFNREYEEYRELHGRVLKSTNVFQQLRARLYAEQEGSAPYEEIKVEIVQQYKALKKDPNYSSDRKRCDYLHRKLSHIKKLISDYDTSTLHAS